MQITYTVRIPLLALRAPSGRTAAQQPCTPAVRPEPFVKLRINTSILAGACTERAFASRSIEWVRTKKLILIFFPFAHERRNIKIVHIKKFALFF